MKAKQPSFPWLVGVARQKITPSFEVELAGLGYYLNRTGQRVRDDLTVTALVIQSKNGECVAIVALDILYCYEEFVRNVRTQVAARTQIPAHSICINCSHSHNAPTISVQFGIGEINPAYVQMVAAQT